MCSISGLEFEAAWTRRDTLQYGDVTVPVLSLEDTILTKKASGRPKDGASRLAFVLAYFFFSRFHNSLDSTRPQNGQ